MLSELLLWGQPAEKPFPSLINEKKSSGMKEVNLEQGDTKTFSRTHMPQNDNGYRVQNSSQ